LPMGRATAPRIPEAETLRLHNGFIDHMVRVGPRERDSVGQLLAASWR
jgi:hypothetical protein